MPHDTYLVSTSHSSPNYVWFDEPVQVRRDTAWDAERKCSVPYGYYVMHSLLGCGKTYPTAEDAIRAICHDHGMTVLSIVPQVSFR